MNAAQSDDEIRLQARASRARIVEEVGACTAFAYPFGNTDDVSPAAWHSVRDAGYDHAFTTLSGSLDGGPQSVAPAAFTVSRPASPTSPRW